MRNFLLCIFYSFEKFPKRSVISGIRSIRFALYPVCVKSGLRQKNPMGNLFVTLKNSQRNVISGIRYIWNSLYPVCAQSRMGCVIVEGDSSPQHFFTVLKYYYICHFLGLLFLLWSSLSTKAPTKISGSQFAYWFGREFHLRIVLTFKLDSHAVF